MRMAQVSFSVENVGLRGHAVTTFPSRTCTRNCRDRATVRRARLTPRDPRQRAVLLLHLLCPAAGADATSGGAVATGDNVPGRHAGAFALAPTDVGVLLPAGRARTDRL